jgi:type IV pilus assembly protein PilV
VYLTPSRRFAASAALRARLDGFSLVEVLVALVVLGIGLLGIAKLEGAAFSNTSVAARRSIAALEADSLAASMHANRGYWSSLDPAGASITVTTNTVTVASGAGANLAAAVAAAPNCASNTTFCTIQNMAAYDLANWALALQGVLPNYSATVNCGTGTPVSCTINIVWSENAVAVNSTEASAAASAASATAILNAFEYPSYTLYVQP